jgi:hypothetical protein
VVELTELDCEDGRQMKMVQGQIVSVHVIPVVRQRKQKSLILIS